MSLVGYTCPNCGRDVQALAEASIRVGAQQMEDALAKGSPVITDVSLVLFDEVRGAFRIEGDRAIPAVNVYVRHDCPLEGVGS